MSTEKSLLTYQNVEHLLKRDAQKEGLQIPIGVDTTGSMHIAELEINRSSSHMLLCGICGSGKSKAIQFVLRGLFQMYGRDLGISCIDGKGVEIESYRRILHNSHPCATEYLMSSCDSEYTLDMLLHFILNSVEAKKDNHPEIIILEEVDQFVRQNPGRFHNILSALAHIAPRRNTHILYSTQVGLSVNSTSIHSAMSFDLVCATRLSTKDSIALFGCDLGSKEGGTRRYGDITFKYKDSVTRVAVPFCSYH